MKTVICFKLCKDPKDATIGPDGKADWGMAALAASDDDYRATEIAKSLGAETIGLTIGNGDVAYGAARGAKETMVITDAMPDADSMTCAKVLAEAIKKIGDVELVLFGDSVWEMEVGTLTGVLLGWNTLAGVVDVKNDDGALIATRRNSTGEKDIKVTLPCVLGIVAKAGEETPPGLKQVLMARKKKVERLTKADLGIETTETVKVTGAELPENTDAVMITGETPEDVVDHLFAALSEKGVL